MAAFNYKEFAAFPHLTADGQSLLELESQSANRPATIYRLHIASGERSVLVTTNATVSSSFAVSPNEQIAATGSEEVFEIDLRTGDTIGFRTGGGLDLMVNDSGDLMLDSTSGWQRFSRKLAQSVVSQVPLPAGLQFASKLPMLSPNGEHAALFEDNQVALLNLKSGNQTAALRMSVQLASWDGSEAVTVAKANGEILRVSLNGSQRLVGRTPSHTPRSISAAGDLAVIERDSQTLDIYDPVHQQVTGTVRPDVGQIQDFVLCGDGTRLMVIGEGKAVAVSDLRPGMTPRVTPLRSEFPKA